MELRNGLKSKQHLDLTRWYFESVGERLIIHSVVVDPLISHLEKERKLYPCQTPYLKRNFRRVKYYNLGKLNSKYKY